MDTTVNALIASLVKADPNDGLRWAPAGIVGQDAYMAFCHSGGAGYTPDGFFHFFGSAGPVEHSLEEWNSSTQWHQHFDVDAAWFAFAEDVFGHQFCLRRDGRRPVVKVLDPWLGSFTMAANGFGHFVSGIVLGDKIWEPLRSLYRKTARLPGMQFRKYCHLSPKVAPVLGGSADFPDDFEWCSSSTDISLLGQLHFALKDVPPGSVVERVDVDPATGQISLKFANKI